MPDSPSLRDTIAPGLLAAVAKALGVGPGFHMDMAHDALAAIQGYAGRTADANFTEHGWPEDSPHVQGNLASAAKLREAADRIDALEAAMDRIEILITPHETDTLPPTLIEKHVLHIARVALGRADA